MWYGVGGELENFAMAEDVAAHEYTHGVIEHSSSLIYRNQSGALMSPTQIFLALWSSEKTG